MFQFPQLQHLREGHVPPRLPIPPTGSPMPNLPLPPSQIPTLLNHCHPIVRHPGSPHPLWGIQQTCHSQSNIVDTIQTPMSSSSSHQMPHEVQINTTPKMHPGSMGMEENLDNSGHKMYAASNQNNSKVTVNLDQGASVNVFWDKAQPHKQALVEPDVQSGKMQMDNRISIEQNINRMVERFTAVKQENYSSCQAPHSEQTDTLCSTTHTAMLESIAKQAYSKVASNLLAEVGSEIVISSASTDPVKEIANKILAADNKHRHPAENFKSEWSHPNPHAQYADGNVKRVMHGSQEGENKSPKQGWQCPSGDSMPKAHASQLELQHIGRGLPSQPDDGSMGQKQCHPGSAESWSSSASKDNDMVVKLKLKNTNKQQAPGCQKKHFCCKVCGKTFAKSEKLRVHQQTHSDEKLYECSDCEWAFRRREHLIRHMMTHTGEMPFECKTCGHKFRRNEHLKRHQLVHTGETPYQCTRCDKQFKRSERLRRHMSTHLTALVSPKLISE